MSTIGKQLEAPKRDVSDKEPSISAHKNDSRVFAAKRPLSGIAG